MSHDLTPAADTALATFQRERGRLFGIAYRMLGSVREAEDVVQDAYLRWHGVEHATVSNPSAYLARLVTHLCLDLLKSASHRRTDYVGVWLPEPLVETPAADDPAALTELADDLSTAFLLLLERLTPVERAVFLLRESFDFSYREIAAVVGKTEENCRQIERRARKHLFGGGRPAPPADPEEHERLLARFLVATRDGDLQGLLDVLAEEVVSYSDGGGKARAALNPIVGADHVARFFLGIRRKAPEDFSASAALVNGRPGVVFSHGGRVHSVLSIQVEDGKIRRVFLTVNPDKLPRA